MPSTIVWIQKWTEYERGWGSRPSGYTIHSRKEDINSFLENMRQKEKKIYQGAVPDEYDAPEGDPYQTEITDAVTLAELSTSECGIWGKTGNKYPDPINRTGQM